MKEFENTRNPILPVDVHIPDCEAHVMSDGRLYIYGSLDNRDGEYCSDRFHVVSTPDMKQWKIHDVSFTGQEVPWFADPNAKKYPGIDWANPSPYMKEVMRLLAADFWKSIPKKICSSLKGKSETKLPILFAPDCLEKDGKYYLYFCMPDESEGVAVSLTPEGPFKNAVQLPCGGIDPAIFTDDDGQVYYYWGQIRSHGIKLNDDMVSFEQKNVVDNIVTEEEHFFHEGSSMRKIGELYYYVYTDMERGKPTSIGYATSKSPLGPFTYRGIIIDNEGCDPQSWNNHGSIECFDGCWYVFYHRSSRGCKQYRRLCMEPIKIREDGTIDEVVMTSQGVGEPFASGESIMGYQACALKGKICIGVDRKYGERLTHIAAGDEAVFRYVKGDKEWSDIEITYSGKGEIDILMNQKLAGTMSLSGEKGKEQTATACIHMLAGQYEVMLRFRKAKHLEVMKLALYGGRL